MNIRIKTKRINRLIVFAFHRIRIVFFLEVITLLIYQLAVEVCAYYTLHPINSYMHIITNADRQQTIVEINTMELVEELLYVFLKSILIMIYLYLYFESLMRQSQLFRSMDNCNDGLTSIPNFHRN